MLLTPQRNLKIADFGVARVEAQNPKDMTGATGTLGYMAPEVHYATVLDLYRNDYCHCISVLYRDNCLEQLVSVQVLEGKPYNRKCDVYSFGICLWEIYCCDMPYPDLSFADVSSAVVHQVCFQLLDSLSIIVHIPEHKRQNRPVILCVRMHVPDLHYNLMVST